MRENLQLKSVRLKNRLRVLLLITLPALSGHVIAGSDFFSIATDTAVMYDAPSLKAEKLYVASLHWPVEAIVIVEGWVKVQDNSGSLTWVEKKILSDKRYVIVTVPLADIYQAADTNSALLFQAQENVVMEWLDSAVMGWVKIRHHDGQTGYVRANQVWGS